MTSVGASADTPRQHYWATDLPLLRPSMLLPRSRPCPSVFPFSHANVQYVYFARNAIYALAQQLGLSGVDVVMPAYFHGVEVEALLAAGVRPRFFRVHAGMRVDPEDIVRSLRPDTRAIYLIHYLGFPGPVEEVRAICRARGLLLIEDCALALLSRLGDQPLGSFGDAAVFCLYKTLPTPNGGAVVLQRGRLQLRGAAPNVSSTAIELALSLLRSMETSAGPLGRATSLMIKAAGKAVTRATGASEVGVGSQHFNVADVSVLMSSVSRTILAAQNCEAIFADRRRNYLHLESLLRDLSPPVFAGLPAGVCPLFYPFATAHKRALRTRLRVKGIQAVLFWLAPGVGPAPGEFPEVDVLRETILELPCHQGMTSNDIERLAHAVRASVRDVGRA